jgi:hypothetical protein
MFAGNNNRGNSKKEFKLTPADINVISRDNEKPIITQLISAWPAFYKTQMFIATFNKQRQPLDATISEPVQ